MNYVNYNQDEYWYSVDYVNRFVDVDTISEENSIRCKFLSKSNEPNSSKLFQITFFDDNCQTKILKLEDNTTGESVSLSLGKISDKIGSYCFKSMASNDILTVNINGTYDVTEGKIKFNQANLYYYSKLSRITFIHHAFIQISLHLQQSII